MPPAPSLGEFEQIVMLGVLQCGDGAYGVPICQEIERRTGRTPSLAAVYKTLDRLEAKGLLRSQIGRPTAERGGRAKRFYSPTTTGLRILKTTLRSLARMTTDLDEVLGT